MVPLIHKAVNNLKQQKESNYDLVTQLLEDNIHAQ